LEKKISALTRFVSNVQASRLNTKEMIGHGE
jgi:hypothetical protein